ncbi:MAG: hypothetical protein HGA23_08050 [Bacteroidales bacterium]|nr:hypothetical protein [Bacteroidales bacterium]
MQAAFIARNCFFFGAFEQNAFVAQIYIGVVNWDLPELEIVYFVDRYHEGQGYVTEAVKVKFIENKLLVAAAILPGAATVLAAADPNYNVGTTGAGAENSGSDAAPSCNAAGLATQPVTLNSGTRVEPLHYAHGKDF